MEQRTPAAKDISTARYILRLAEEAGIERRDRVNLLKEGEYLQVLRPKDLIFFLSLLNGKSVDEEGLKILAQKVSVMLARQAEGKNKYSAGDKRIFEEAGKVIYRGFEREVFLDIPLASLPYLTGLLSRLAKVAESNQEIPIPETARAGVGAFRKNVVVFGQEYIDGFDPGVVGERLRQEQLAWERDKFTTPIKSHQVWERKAQEEEQRLEIKEQRAIKHLTEELNGAIQYLRWYEAHAGLVVTSKVRLNELCILLQRFRDGICAENNALFLKPDEIKTLQSSLFRNPSREEGQAPAPFDEKKALFEAKETVMRLRAFGVEPRIGYEDLKRVLIGLFVSKNYTDTLEDLKKERDRFFSEKGRQKKRLPPLSKEEQQIWKQWSHRQGLQVRIDNFDVARKEEAKSILIESAERLDVTTLRDLLYFLKGYVIGLDQRLGEDTKLATRSLIPMVNKLPSDQVVYDFRKRKTEREVDGKPDIKRLHILPEQHPFFLYAAEYARSLPRKRGEMVLRPKEEDV